MPSQVIKYNQIPGGTTTTTKKSKKKGAGHNAKRLVLRCINGVSSNPVEGRRKICHLKDLILTLLGFIFRHIYAAS